MLLKAPKAEHTRLIKHAKELLEIKQAAKWQICEIALEVCFIQDTKGKVPKDAYTITLFAEEIGMNRKTLSCWILDYQTVYKPLGINDSKMSFADRLRFNSAVSQTRAKLFNFNKKSKKSVIKTKSEVREVFDKVMSKDVLIKRLEDFIRNLKHHEYTFTHGKLSAKHRTLIVEYKAQSRKIDAIIEKIMKENM
jgi:signal transduction protein with GAF and PtsI domain